MRPRISYPESPKVRLQLQTTLLTKIQEDLKLSEKP